MPLLARTARWLARTSDGTSTSASAGVAPEIPPGPPIGDFGAMDECESAPRMPRP